MPADLAEQLVWDQVSAIIRNPGSHLDALRRDVRERAGLTVNIAERRKPLLDALAEKQAERERVIELHRRGRVTADEADRELDAVADDVTELLRQIESLDEQVAGAEGLERDLRDAAVMLEDIRAEVDHVEQTNDLDAKRAIIERLARSVTVTTLPSPRKHRKPYALRSNSASRQNLSKS